ncbi:hypothetical protein [Hymenobacter glacieicola]|uniref:Uncharacterized protein n=1 Tax=Hymenobacter glacieicola TaxID=1562124 RepID=A0ABQ1WN22_9BACT|nr:hypothetical protein [Hymenobacter glacieicola]GGG36045.1 hypothetical protein GCM10011378_10440 [Hymenobacter glacieicola]
MDPKNTSKQPKPAENTLPAKGTTDTQSADADHATNLPRPEATPTEPAETSSETETPTDSTASTTSSDSGGDSDPSASNTSNDEPL